VRAVSALVRKDLLLELRTKETVPAMALFALVAYVLFHFALRRNTLEGDLAAGVLWVTILLAAVLGINRLFVAEREQGGFDGFLLAPVDRTAMLVAKATALLCFLVVLEVIAVPAFFLLLLGPSAGPAFPELLAIIADDPNFPGPDLLVDSDIACDVGYSSFRKRQPVGMLPASGN